MSKKYLNTNQSHVKFFMLSQMRSQCEQLCELFAKILRKTGRERSQLNLNEFKFYFIEIFQSFSLRKFYLLRYD